MTTAPKLFRIRVRAIDGRPREPNQLKGKLFPHVDVLDAGGKVEFVLCALTEKHLADVRAKLASAGLEEIPKGEVDVVSPSDAPRGGPPRRGGESRPGRYPPRPAQGEQQQAHVDLRKRPYDFVPLPDGFTTREPVWHDGSSSAGRLSGEIRCELENLTPLLVGWERRQVVAGEEDADWPIPFTRVDRDEKIVEVSIGGERTRTVASKSLLCPLRAPWGDRPVIIPGDSLKGLLRHELGALLGAPMERVAERSYSYRPNSLYPNQPNPRLIPRLARVPGDGVKMRDLYQGRQAGRQVRVPVALELLPDNLRYDRNHDKSEPRYRFDPRGGGSAYRGGLGAGRRLNSKRQLHNRLEATPSQPATRVAVPPDVQEGYLNTLRHLTDPVHGHFTERHPDVPSTVSGEDARERILEAATREAFSVGDLVWVEWDTRQQRIVSVGWHYYYRWAYLDTVRRRGGTSERGGLFPLPQERGDVPHELSAVRRLFGYTGDNEGSAGIGKDDHSQLMGRISVNAALEVVPAGARHEERFLPPTFLKELGMPRPSAVEFYLKQPHHPRSRPSDQASLVTYGDAAGYDEPGQLAGRKFYLDRRDAYTGSPWVDASESNRLNDRSTLALEASRPHRRFRFTVRFRDLDADELAAVLLALCPHQFCEDVKVNSRHSDGYCSKLGYARPLGWGTVRVEVKDLLLLTEEAGTLKLDGQPDVRAWFRRHFRPPSSLQEWLGVHRHKHPDGADYQRKNGEIYTFHTSLRAEHSRRRRYDTNRNR